MLTVFWDMISCSMKVISSISDGSAASFFKVEKWSSEMSVTIYQTTRHHILLLKTVIFIVTAAETSNLSWKVTTC
jgi:hypothetical protein